MKRANGTGTIVRLSGNRRRPYCVRVSSRDEYNHIVQRALSYHATVGEAQEALDRYNRDRERGIAPLPGKLGMTVGQVFEAWSTRAYRKLQPDSIRSHNAAWKKRVSRYQDRKLRDVSLAEWQSILDEDEDAGLSQSLINNDAALIRALYSYGMKHEIVGKDLSQYLEIPSVGSKITKGTLTDIQLAQIEELAKAGFPYADTVLMLCYTGFRISEFLSLTRFSYHEDGDYLQGGVKSAAGKNRIVPVHPKIRPYLMVRLTQNGDRLVCSPKGKPMTRQQYAPYFEAVMQKIGADGVTPHWCRHTFSTRLHSAGVDMLTIKWLMGHSTDSDITEHYTHATILTLQQAISHLA